MPTAVNITESCCKSYIEPCEEKIQQYYVDVKLSNDSTGNCCVKNGLKMGIQIETRNQAE